MKATILHGDCKQTLRTLAAESVHCCVTSPPYFALRSYLPKDHPDKALEIGSEKSIGAFVETMVDVFREVKRVLHSSGVCWINLGDTRGGGRGGNPAESAYRKQATNVGSHVDPFNSGLPSGNLCGVPWRTAFALQADGWILRDAIVWAKGVSGEKRFGSVMPESVSGTAWRRCRVKVANGKIKRGGPDTDGMFAHQAMNHAEALGLTAQWQPCEGCSKCSATNGWVLRQGSGRCTSAYEMLFMLTKGKGYYWDDLANAEDQSENTNQRAAQNGEPSMAFKMGDGGENRNNASFQSYMKDLPPDAKCNPRNVLYIPTAPYPDAHFATYPKALVEFCIRASTSEEGVCPACLWPYARMVESKQLTRERPNDKTARHEAGGGVNACGNTVAGVESKTVGWRATCKCEAGAAIPATVLDPFMGSGTTAIAALELGRSAIGCELSESYIKDHIEPRITAVKQRYALFA